MPPGAHPPPWDPGQEAWSRACPVVGMRDTWHLPAITACLLWPGLADRGTQECGVGGGNSQPGHPPLGPPHGFLLSFPQAWAQCLGIRILDPSLRGETGLWTHPASVVWLFPSFRVLPRSILLAQPSLHTQPHGTPPPGHQVHWGKRSVCLQKLAAPGIPSVCHMYDLT